MDMIIEAYIKATYHPELADVIRHAFRLFDDFELPDYEFDFVNLLMSSDDMHPQSTQDHFTTFIHQKLDFIIHAHMIVLLEATALHQKVAVLEGLYAVQHQNDYSNIITILEAEYPGEEKLAEILGQVCEVTPMELLTILDRFDEEVLKTLKNYVYNKQGNEGKLLTSYTELQLRIIENLKLFKKYREGKNCLGLLLLDSNVLIGQTLEAYVPYIDDYLKNPDYGVLSVDIFSLILLSNEGFNNPILTFRKHSGLLLDNLEAISKVDVLLTHLTLEFEKYKSNLNITGQSS